METFKGLSRKCDHSGTSPCTGHYQMHTRGFTNFFSQFSQSASAASVAEKKQFTSCKLTNYPHPDNVKENQHAKCQDQRSSSSYTHWNFWFLVTRARLTGQQSLFECKLIYPIICLIVDSPVHLYEPSAAAASPAVHAPDAASPQHESDADAQLLDSVSTQSVLSPANDISAPARPSCTQASML